MSTFQLLNGLTFAALLFVVASGFILIFGLLRIVNLAHGALYLLGGYVGFTVAARTGSFMRSCIRRGWTPPPFLARPLVVLRRWPVLGMVGRLRRVCVGLRLRFCSATSLHWRI